MDRFGDPPERLRMADFGGCSRPPEIQSRNRVGFPLKLKAKKVRRKRVVGRSAPAT
jgi:hypothetical protein